MTSMSTPNSYNITSSYPPPAHTANNEKQYNMNPYTSNEPKPMDSNSPNPSHSHGISPDSLSGHGTQGQKKEYNSHRHLPFHHGKKVTKGIKADGESGRKGFHPFHFLRICFRSSCTLSKYVNLLWPFVPAAFAVQYGTHNELWTFILAYIAIVPAANLLGFAGQELARKLPQVFGVIVETTLGSIVEIVLFTVLVTGGNDNVPVIRAAILGSILANLLLCLGVCFFAGGLRRQEQTFHEAVSEVGSNLMLVAGMALIVPAAFSTALNGSDTIQQRLLERRVLEISRATAIILIFSYGVYVFFQARSHHGMYEDLLMEDEEKDADRHKDLNKAKLTLTEAIVALVISITVVSFMAVFLVKKIHYIVEHHGVKDAFLGLILIPLVEKAAEHITAVDEAWDNQINFAMAHVLGSSIQTALFNTPLVILVGWGLGVSMDLNFEIFDATVLILAILVVGNFLRDGKSNYLEGFLCVVVYLVIAIAAFWYPNPKSPMETVAEEGANNGTEAAALAVAFGETASSTASAVGEAATQAAAELAKRFLRSIGEL